MPQRGWCGAAAAAALAARSLEEKLCLSFSIVLSCAGSWASHAQEAAEEAVLALEGLQGKQREWTRTQTRQQQASSEVRLLPVQTASRAMSHPRSRSSPRLLSANSRLLPSNHSHTPHTGAPPAAMAVTHPLENLGVCQGHLVPLAAGRMDGLHGEVAGWVGGRVGRVGGRVGRVVWRWEAAGWGGRTQEPDRMPRSRTPPCPHTGSRLPVQHACTLFAAAVPLWQYPAIERQVGVCL